MDVSHIKVLLKEASQFHKPRRERTLFDIGARGYFENPTTDLLAFFCYPEGEHGLGDAVLVALLDCLPPKNQPASGERYLTCRPEREWVTSLEQRIDLVLKSDNWVLAIENKIYHGLQNDFIHYADDLTMRLAGSDSRQMLYAVLSPDGRAPDAPGWLGISYSDLLCRLRETIGTLYEQYGDNKWLLFLREFALHLENLTMTETLTEVQEQYVLKHLGEIDALAKIKDNALLSLRQRLQEGINEAISDLGITVNDKQENWDVGPALRFVPDGWKGNSSVVVFLSKDHPGTVRVQPYIDKQNGDYLQLRTHGIDINRFDDHGASGNSYVFFHDFSSMDWEAVEKAAARYMRSIIQMENGWQQEAVTENDNGQ